MAEDSVLSWVVLTVVAYGAFILALAKAVGEKTEGREEDFYGR